MTNEASEREAFETWLRREYPLSWALMTAHETALMRDAWKGARAAAPAVHAPPQKIAAIIELLHTQDNRITAHPLFAVQQKRIVYGLHEDYASELRWVDDDGECSQEDANLYDAKRENGDPLPGGVRRLGLIEQWEFVTGCMTEQGCKDFIACNGHNLKQPRIYAYSGYRNAEFIAVREWLMSLYAAAPTAAQAVPTDGEALPRKCLYCDREMLAGSECLSKAQSENCMGTAGVPAIDYSKPAWPLHGMTAEEIRAAEPPYMDAAERRKRKGASGVGGRDSDTPAPSHADGPSAPKTGES
jgi:hypothetical protein